MARTFGKGFLVACALLVLASCARSDDSVSIDPGRPTYASLHGPISDQSAISLRRWMDSHRGQPLHLALSSGGGSAFPAIDASRMIKARGNVDTVVHSATKCASACTFLWLAGNHRTVEPGGELAFHGAQCPLCIRGEVPAVDAFQRGMIAVEPRVALLLRQLHGLDQHGYGHGTVIQSAEDGTMVAWDESAVSAWIGSHGQGPRPGLWTVDVQGHLAEADLGKCGGC